MLLLLEIGNLAQTRGHAPLPCRMDQGKGGHVYIMMQRGQNVGCREYRTGNIINTVWQTCVTYAKEFQMEMFYVAYFRRYGPKMT